MRARTGAESDAIMLHSTLHTKKMFKTSCKNKEGRQIRFKEKRWKKI